MPDYTPDNQQAKEEKSSMLEQKLRTFSFLFLNKANFLIYTLVGFCFLIVAFLGLAYCIWDFSTIFTTGISPTTTGQSIILLISNLLLVLIIMEVLGTVMHYLESRETSLRPFLYISIISATRGILSIGARLSLEGLNIRANEFTQAMIELGVNGAVILALGITIRMLGHGAHED